MASVAYQTRKLRAAREKLARDLEYANRVAENNIANLYIQLAGAQANANSSSMPDQGFPRNPTFTGVFKSGGTVYIAYAPNPLQPNVRSKTGPAKSYSPAPPASAIPNIKKAIEIAEIQKGITRAETSKRWEEANVVPIGLLVVNTNKAMRGLVAAERNKIVTASQSDKDRVSRMYGFDNTIYQGKKKIAEIQGSTFTDPPPKKPFLIQGTKERYATLKETTGYDIEAQLNQSNSRFDLNLNLDDIISNEVSGSIFNEAIDLFKRNQKIDNLKTTLTPVGPQTENIDEFADFDKLYERRQSIADQQTNRLNDILNISDTDLKIATLETDLPLFKERTDFIDNKINILDQKITDLRKTRKPQNLLVGTGSLANYGIKTMVDRRNTLTTIRNAKADEINAIKDPAEKFLAIEQDLPSLDNRIIEIDKDINRGLEFADSRKKLDITFQDQPTKGRRPPKYFTLDIGGESREFRRNTRGAQGALAFIEEQKGKKLSEINAMDDKVFAEVVREQDVNALSLTSDLTKQQRKALKFEKLSMIDMGGGASGDFYPETPSDTPTGTLAIDPLPKSRGIPKVFGQATSRGRGRGGMGFMDRNSFDIGKLYGGSAKIPKRQNDFTYDFF